MYPTCASNVTRPSPLHKRLTIPPTLTSFLGGCVEKKRKRAARVTWLVHNGDEFGTKHDSYTSMTFIMDSAN